MESVTRTTGKINFLLDGFPRSLGNMDAWHQVEKEPKGARESNDRVRQPVPKQEELISNSQKIRFHARRGNKTDARRLRRMTTSSAQHLIPILELPYRKSSSMILTKFHHEEVVLKTESHA